MTVLVTGGAGYIGSHMVLALRDAGREVVVIDNLATGHRWALPGDVPFVEGDVGDGALLSRLFDTHPIDAVLHFAASSVVPDSVVRPLDYYRNNTAATRTLLEAAAGAGVRRFVFSSTAAVYGMTGLAPVSEEVEPRPINPYGRSKLMCEWMLADTAAVTELSYIAMRYFNVAGADPEGRIGQSTPEATHLIKVAVEAATGRRPFVEIFGVDYETPDGTGIRDYIHVTDLVGAHLRALTHLEAGGASSIVNCGYGRGYSVREVLTAVEAETNAKLDIRVGPRRDGDAAAAVADPSLIARVLGFEPRYDDLRTIVRHALDWERRERARMDKG